MTQPEADTPVTLTLPAVQFPENEIATSAGRLLTPAWGVPEKTIAVIPSLLGEMTTLARAAAAEAHAPYSGFHVGAALVMADDPNRRIFTGCNVENASYGATVCAERNAIATAVGAGFRRIAFLTVSTIDSLDGPIAGRSPCGICRQTIFEFSGSDSLVIIDSGASDCLGEIIDRDRLLPWGFQFEG